MSAEKVRENRVRRQAGRLGYRLCRSRARLLHVNNRGLYQVVSDRNEVVLGVDFDASLDDAEGFLAERERELLGSWAG